MADHRSTHPVPHRAIALVLLLALGLAFAGPAYLSQAKADDYDMPIFGGVHSDEDPPDDPDEDEPPKFYDEEIPATSDSVIFVVDRSSSMTLPSTPYMGLDGQPVNDGTRLDFVKTELVRSIQSLPESFSFNIVIYSECVDSWKPQRVQATAGIKTEAIAWVNAIQPWGWTNTGGATSLALGDRGNKAIMLLSDGAPNFLDCAQTYVGDFDTHRSVIRSANQQQAVIHCFGIGLDAETRTFMAQVAAENGGTFRELD